ncbi:MAG: hypothetical protein CMP49_04005 [Flavobacteriales bacterium]|nr:hypothetical protein [Flavobacteriales bacterium]|tara:strand:- start:4754 stop:5914 length:1161 start_codon:yes stop_codon:yes gene_type:complete
MVNFFGDKIIWTVSTLLFLISILLVYSSGGYQSLSTHFTHLLMGLGLIFIFSRFNYKYFTNLSSILLIASIIMLLWLIVNPTYYRGDILASRWIKLGFISFQPSELAKYSLILFICRNLYIYKHFLNSFKSFFIYILCPVIIICALIVQSNLSTVLLIISILFFIVFISGYPISLFFKHLILPSFILFSIFFTMLCLPPITVVDNLLPRLTTWKNRICAKQINQIPFSWVDDSNYNPKENHNNNYQINNALGAINSGGLIGKGAGKSYYKRLLPDSKSDFIYAILLEEYGLIGGLVVLFLYLLFYQRILVLSIKSRDEFPRLLLLGLGSVIVFQALLHMGVSVDLIPVTGQTLPLISKGGSSVWVTSLAFGIILNISHQINNQENN